MLEAPENFMTISFIIMFSAVILLSVVIVLRQWLKNKHSPLIVTQALVLTKRVEMHYSSRSNVSRIRTRHKFYLYYVTF